MQLLSRGSDGSWPDDAIAFGRGESVSLASIDLTCPVEAIYAGTRLAGP